MRFSCHRASYYSRFYRSPNRGRLYFSTLSSALFAIVLLCYAEHCIASENQVESKPLQGLSLIGQGEMHWMAWHLYDARLYSADGYYRPQGYPLALAISYARTIDKKHLVSATTKAWSRLHIDAPSSWVQRLSNIWPSVNKSDELVFYVTTMGIGQFYYNGDLIGEIDDSDFSAAFLAIWLHPETSGKSLRAKLIGGRVLPRSQQTAEPWGPKEETHDK